MPDWLKFVLMILFLYATIALGFSCCMWITSFANLSRTDTAAFAIAELAVGLTALSAWCTWERNGGGDTQ